MLTWFVRLNTGLSFRSLLSLNCSTTEHPLKGVKAGEIGLRIAEANATTDEVSEVGEPRETSVKFSSRPDAVIGDVEPESSNIEEGTPAKEESVE